MNEWILSRTKIFNYAIKTDLKNARNQLKFAKKVDLASLKSEVDKLDND